MFSDKVGQPFAIDEPDAPAIELTLTKAEPLPTYNVPPAARAPFSLLFTTTGDFVLMQRMYALRHAALGALTIFLVPVGKTADTVTYQAIFN
jgi:hypothetical protein